MSASKKKTLKNKTDAALVMIWNGEISKVDYESIGRVAVMEAGARFVSRYVNKPKRKTRKRKINLKKRIVKYFKDEFGALPEDNI